MAETYFDILGLSPISDFGKIAIAYQQKKTEFKGDPNRLHLIEEAYRVLMNPMSLRKYLEDLKPVEVPATTIEKDSTQAVSLSETKKGLPPDNPLRSSGKRQKTELFEFGKNASPQPVSPVPAVQKSGRQRTELFEPESGKAPSGEQQAAPADITDVNKERQQAALETNETSLKSDQPASKLKTTKPHAHVMCLYAGETNEYQLKEGENIIGRPPKNGTSPDIPLVDADHFISRRHAVILVKGSKYLLQDMGSDNGSSLNGERLLPLTSYPLKDGDVIDIEERQLIVHISE